MRTVENEAEFLILSLRKDTKKYFKFNSRSVNHIQGWGVLSPHHSFCGIRRKSPNPFTQSGGEKFVAVLVGKNGNRWINSSSPRSREIRGKFFHARAGQLHLEKVRLAETLFVDCDSRRDNIMCDVFDWDGTRSTQTSYASSSVLPLLFCSLNSHIFLFSLYWCLSSSISFIFFIFLLLSPSSLYSLLPHHFLYFCICYKKCKIFWT